VGTEKIDTLNLAHLSPAPPSHAEQYITSASAYCVFGLVLVGNANVISDLSR